MKSKLNNTNQLEDQSLNDALNNGAATSKKSVTRGFASMEPSRQREIASEGGRAAHKQGTAHEWTSDEARIAGRKGGQSRTPRT